MKMFGAELSGGDAAKFAVGVLVMLKLYHDGTFGFTGLFDKPASPGKKT